MENLDISKILGHTLLAIFTFISTERLAFWFYSSKIDTSRSRINISFLNKEYHDKSRLKQSDVTFNYFRLITVGLAIYSISTFFDYMSINELDSQAKSSINLIKYNAYLIDSELNCSSKTTLEGKERIFSQRQNYLCNIVTKYRFLDDLPAEQFDFLKIHHTKDKLQSYINTIQTANAKLKMSNEELKNIAEKTNNDTNYIVYALTLYITVMLFAFKSANLQWEIELLKD